MSGGRPIHLDLGMPSSSGMDIRHGSEQPPQSPARDAKELAQDADRLRDLLKRNAAAEPRGAGPSSTTGNAPMVATAFQLFNPAAQRDASSAPAPDELSAAMAPTIDEMARRLLVSDGQDGRRAVQIQLSDEAMPGTVMDVFEEEGAITAVFTCRLENTRERLSRNVQWLADQLAERLARSTCVRVQADDPESPGLVEARTLR